MLTKEQIERERQELEGEYPLNHPCAHRINVLCDQALEALSLRDDAEQLRKMLFLKVVGHPEHHHTHACGSCDNLREVINASRGAQS